MIEEDWIKKNPSPSPQSDSPKEPVGEDIDNPSGEYETLN